MTKGKWYEVYATNKNPVVKCTTAVFMKKDAEVQVHHEGKDDNAKIFTNHIMGNISETYESLYEISDDSKFHHRNSYHFQS